MDEQVMSQQTLFYERIEDAIAAVVDACGGRKVVASELWPDKPLRDAHNLLDACLNPSKREKLDPSQIVYIAKRGRQVGCHLLVAFICRECSYADPIPLEPEDERAKLQREYIEATKAMASLAARMERVSLVRAA